MPDTEFRKGALTLPSLLSPDFLLGLFSAWRRRDAHRPAHGIFKLYHYHYFASSVATATSGAFSQSVFLIGSFFLSSTKYFTFMPCSTARATIVAGRHDCKHPRRVRRSQTDARACRPFCYYRSASSLGWTSQTATVTRRKVAGMEVAS